MSETVLITGANGFVGGWCVVEALKRGYRVRATVRSADKETSVRAMAAAAGFDPQEVSFTHADLLSDMGWDAALADADYVLHVASPLGSGASVGRYAFVPAARDGALRMLGAALRGGAKRIVMTSASAAARAPLKPKRISDETIWADPEDRQFDAYRVSKILAERAAWDFMRTASAEKRLTTILPGAVFGPVLQADTIGSVALIRSLLKGQPGTPRIGFWVVDVRDLAALHIDAMTSPQAAGERFIAAGEFLWMREIADILRDGLGDRATNAPTRELPDGFVRLLALFNNDLRQITPLLGVAFEQSSEKARRLLNFAPRPVAQTVLDCAESLLALG